jgi:phosphoglycolate phosphatase
VTSRFRLFVFDLDGTLINSQRDIADAANLLLESAGAGRLPENVVAQMVGDGAATLVQRAFLAAGVPPPPDALGRFLEIYGSRLVAHTVPYPAVPAVLEVIAQRASVAVLTNKPLTLTRRILVELKLAHYFADDAVVGGGGPFPRKPDPAGLRHLAARAGADLDSTILIGDSIIDWRTAKHASTAVCLARYGFGFQTFPVAELAGDEHLIDSPTELLLL